MVPLAGAVYAGFQGVSIARMAASYAARQTCSCLFVSGRSPESCQGDLRGVVARVTAWQVDGKAVTASVLAIVTARATFEEGYGCHVVR
jgi:hypothetical protein